MTKELLGEVIGTALLILLGNGVVAGVVLDKSKSKDAGWIVITIGWGLAVAMAAFVSGVLGPAHLNPAVSIAMAYAGNLPWASVLPYIGAQFVGAFIGSLLVYLMYKDHYDATEDTGAVLATFSTGPAIRNTVTNTISEAIGTFVLVLALLALGNYDMPVGLGTLTVGALIVSLGVSLGGPTGYALNPARDLGPRIMHAILPLKHKGDSDWGYALVPVLGPIIGGLLAAIFYGMVF
ncbi:MIP/aquaporin family protein [Streptococcus acidominimus]|uniref:Aquaporin family protein n=1 Tax=Streptococcus acidominimus TaxID=1326 RepID=A0A4Y9FKF0_STRAI|nr:MIP/aquaporin family protein [Streptococcus acidominimus]MBF0819720.1 aquaporin family protein [Streptococcus acidominimus]MBF0839871.1 aquaporin family protein [Streptococcus acidominimus]MBF0848098.1 aquaporin family protein [Streptococcus danieliae]TFU29536.1 aquaporin family protein [Streptococcus acidominimus]